MVKYIKENFDEYRRRPDLNHSSLKLIDISPLHYHSPPDIKETKSLTIGKVAHHAILEPDLFRDGYGVMPDKFVRDGKEISARRDKRIPEYLELLNNHPLGILTKEEYDTVNGMASSVRGSHLANKLLTDDCEKEITALGTIRGHECKALVDFTDKSTFAGDIKTIGDISRRKIMRDIMSYGYLTQAAFTCMLMCIRQWQWIFVESKAPYDVAVVELGEPEIDHGMEIVHGWFDDLDRCIESGYWPGVARDSVMRFELPQWAMPPVTTDDAVGGYGWDNEH